MKTILTMFLSVAFFSGCRSIIADNPCDTPIGAIPFVFIISDSSNDDLFSQQYLGKFLLDSVHIYHNSLNGFQKDTINIEKVPSSPSGKHAYAISSVDVLERSLSGTKTFYFRRNANVIDTINFDETNIKDKGGCNDFELQKFTYSGIEVTRTNTYDGNFAVLIPR